MTTTTLPAAASAVEQEMLTEASRFAALLRRVHGSEPVPGMRWTAGDLGAHVVQNARNAATSVRGEGSAYDGIGFSAEVDQRLIDALPERDATRLAEMVETEYPALAEQLRDHPDGEMLGVIDRLTTGSLRAILAIDFMLHGTQIAQATGQAFPIDAERMRTCVAAILPVIARSEATAGVTASFSVRFRGARPLLYGWEDGRLWVDEPGRTADCRVSADCAAFLLQGIGLLPTWKLALTGKAIAGGRKPWLVMHLQKWLPAVPHGGVAA
jgi:uncharacterized protein (TIGR03083 family)